MDHHRIDRGLFQEHDVAGEIARGLLVAHGVAAIFHHHGRLVVALHVRQGFGQDAGLVGRRDVHDAILGSSVFFTRTGIQFA